MPNGDWAIMHKPLDESPPTHVHTIEYGWEVRSLFWSNRFERAYITWSGTLSSVGLVSRERDDYYTIMPILVREAALSPDERTLACWGRDDETREWGLFLSSLYPDTTSPPQMYDPMPEEIGNNVNFIPCYLRFSPDGQKLGLSYFHYLEQTKEEVEQAQDLANRQGDPKVIRGSRGFWIFPIPDGSGAEPYKPFDLSVISRDDPPTFDWLDSNHVLLSHRSYRPEGGLWIGDIRTGELRRITHSALPEMYPSTNPDDKREILISRELIDYDIVEVFLDGRAPRNIISSGMREYSPTLSQDGKLVFITDIGEYADIRLRDDNGNDELLITQDQFQRRDRPVVIWPPAVISPNGELVAFTGSPGGNYSDMTTYICPTAGGGIAEKILPDDYYSSNVGTWDPTSRWLAGNIAPPGELATFSIVRWGDSESLQTVYPRQVAYPAWSPNGRWIAGLARQGHDGPLVFASRDGTSYKEVGFPLESTNTVFFWSYDGATLFAYSTMSSARGVYAFHVDSLPDRVDWEGFEEFDRQFKVSDVHPDHHIGTPFLWAAGGSLMPGGESFITTIRKHTSDLWIFRPFAEPGVWR
jgi:hypothetical protein